MRDDTGDRFTYRYPFSIFNWLEFSPCCCPKCRRANDRIEKESAKQLTTAGKKKAKRKRGRAKRFQQIAA